MLQPGAARFKGKEDGHQAGFNRGYYLGRCQYLTNRLAEEETSLWNCRILYVTAGKMEPYSPLDKAIVEGLNGLVSELLVVNPNQDVVSIAANFRPDLLLVFDSINSFPSENADAIRSFGIKTAVWFADDPYYTDITQDVAPHYDYVFTHELNCIPFYQQFGCTQVHYLPLAVNPREFYPRHVSPEFRSEICFIGSAFQNRVQFFDKIAPYLARKNTIISGFWWDRLKNYSLLKDKIRLGVWMSPEETANYYNGAKIVINLHRSHDDETFNINSRKIEAVSLNPRTFEISGSGTLQITDMRQDLVSFFTPGKDIETYGSPEELVDKIEHYLNHEDERREISLRSYHRIRSEHTYRKRLTRLLQIALA